MQYHWGCAVVHSYCHPSEPQQQRSTMILPLTLMGANSKEGDELQDTWHNVEMGADADAELMDTEVDMDLEDGGDSRDSRDSRDNRDDAEDDCHLDSDFQSSKEEKDREDTEHLERDDMDDDSQYVEYYE